MIVYLRCFWINGRVIRGILTFNHRTAQIFCFCSVAEDIRSFLLPCGQPAVPGHGCPGKAAFARMANQAVCVADAATEKLHSV